MGGKKIQSTDATVENIPHITQRERRPVEGCTSDALFAEILRRATKAMR